MEHTHNPARISFVVFIVATVVCSLTLASASEQVDKKGSPANPAVAAPKKEPAAAKPDLKVGDKPIKADAIGNPMGGKTIRKRHPRNSRKEVLPYDARLTMAQVVELLKTTRDFSGRNLSGLRLVGLDLSRCNFRGADLSNGDLERTDLDESVLERADLSGANLRMTDLRLTGMKGARLERAVLDGALWQDGTICAKDSVGSCRER